MRNLKVNNKSILNITIIGYGKLAKCLVQGFIEHENIRLRVSSPSFIFNIPHELGNVSCSEDNNKYIDDADFILLAVKPQMIYKVVSEIEKNINSSSCLISVAAGLDIASMESGLTSRHCIIRAMPNTSAAINQSPTPLYANKFCTDKQKKQVNYLFEIIGQPVWLDDESQLDVLTALIGSGPAFVYEFIMELSKSSQSLGLPLSKANKLASQMVLGASQIAVAQANQLPELQAQVISKGGTTEAGLKAMRNTEFAQSINSAITKATSRAKELKKT